MPTLLRTSIDAMSPRSRRLDPRVEQARACRRQHVQIAKRSSARLSGVSQETSPSRNRAKAARSANTRSSYPRADRDGRHRAQDAGPSSTRIPRRDDIRHHRRYLQLDIFGPGRGQQRRTGAQFVRARSSRVCRLSHGSGRTFPSPVPVFLRTRVVAAQRNASPYALLGLDLIACACG